MLCRVRVGVGLFASDGNKDYTRMGVPVDDVLDSGASAIVSELICSVCTNIVPYRGACIAVKVSERITRETCCVVSY